MESKVELKQQVSLYRCKMQLMAERAIRNLKARGMTDKEIAAAIGLEEHTVHAIANKIEERTDYLKKIRKEKNGADAE